MSARSPAHSITETSKPGIRTSCFGYDLDGLLTQTGAPAGGAAQKNAYAYDAHGALDALVSTRDADTLFATHYTRDSLSRITTLTERVAGVTQAIGFTYDSVGRLSAVARNGVTTASYTYDLNGNRATKTTSGGVATAAVDDQDRLTSYGGATYAYTNNGELSRKIVGTDTTLYTYDALGNLTDVELPDGTAIGYLIDAQNRRIGKTVNDTLVRAWLYQGQLTPVAELDGQGNVVSRFVYATGVNVPDYLVRGDSTYRLIRDHLGSVRLVVNVASGTVAQRLSYDEFGIETENTNPAWQPFGYAGGLTDAQTGLVRFGARDYDPASGRWTAKDPIGFAGGTTSLYAYAGNDPINFVDPFGLCDLRIIGSATFKEAIAVLRALDPNVEADLKRLESDSALFVIQENPDQVGALTYGGLRPNGNSDQAAVDYLAARVGIADGKVRGFARVGSKSMVGAPPVAWRAAHEAIHLGGLTNGGKSQELGHQGSAFDADYAKWRAAGIWHPRDPRPNP